MEKKKFRVDLLGSEFRNYDAVKIKLDPTVRFRDDDRMADVKFTSDGIDVKVRMMESDLRVLAYAILSNTNPNLDE